MMSVKFSPNALNQFFDVQERDKRLFKALKKIIEDTQRNGTAGLGHPEPLKENLSGLWSKRLNDGNRMVFRIVSENDFDVVEIAECRTHYSDK